jgi:hypothetical protein
MKKPSAVRGDGLPSLAIVEESVTLSMFPSLKSLVCDHNWEDNTPKGKRCLMLFIDEAAARLLVKLEGASLKASCVARSIDDVLMAMEMLLKTDQVVWEQDADRRSPPPRKKK